MATTQVLQESYWKDGHEQLVKTVAANTWIRRFDVPRETFDELAPEIPKAVANLTTYGESQRTKSEGQYSIEYDIYGFTLSQTGTTFYVATWAVATAYKVGDRVVGDGAPDAYFYRCILAHTGHEPPNATYWVRVPGEYVAKVERQEQEPGAENCYMYVTYLELLPTDLSGAIPAKGDILGWSLWSATHGTYNVGDIVKGDGSPDSYFYKCILQHTAAAGNEPPNNTYWNRSVWDAECWDVTQDDKVYEGLVQVHSRWHQDRKYGT